MRGVCCALFGLSAGCATTVTPHMPPPPMAYQLERVDLETALPEALRTTTLPVFYATTREPAAADEPGHYLNAYDKNLRFGVARVALGEPGWTWQDLAASDRSGSIEKPRAGRVEGVEEIGLAAREEGESAPERAFVERINARLAEVRNPEVVLYVHGYRVTFDEVAVLMGSFAHYLGHGAMVTFQWPTGLHFWSYLTDCPRAEREVPDIERTIALLAKTRAEFINIVVYSCGSPLVGQALARLRARHPEEGREALAKRYRIGNVIFAASDVDLKTFAREYVPPVMDLARQMIIYYSRDDAALGFSSLLAGASRLGRPSIEDLTVQDLERLGADPRLQAIDVTGVRGPHEQGGMRGHGYWYANDWISTDVVLSLRYPIPPRRRCLTPGRGTNIWEFPEDYDRCLEDALWQDFPQLRRARPGNGNP
jgi:esterase/lipase superfamily enzyme